MKFLVADDHCLVREGLKTVLGDLIPGVQVDAVGSLHEAITALNTQSQYTLALLDLNMPGMIGVASIKSFCALAPQLPVVILSGSEHIADISATLEHGARGYIPKTAAPQTMLFAIELVLAGGIYTPPSMNYGHTGSKKQYQLTPRQIEVLHALAQGRSNKEIARDLSISEGTVKSHLDAILGELLARNRTHAVIIAQSAGLIS